MEINELNNKKFYSVILTNKDGQEYLMTKSQTYGDFLYTDLKRLKRYINSFINKGRCVNVRIVCPKITFEELK